MKKISTKILLLVLLSFSTLKMNAQTICMVTADFQSGEDYMVMWEQLADVTLIDSIFIYRQAGTETVFSKIGAVDVTLTSPTYFVDANVNTMDTTKYYISYLYTSGTESTRSYWHQPSVLDYDDVVGGDIVWTKYKKEDQIDESYIFSYECFMDPIGLGNFQSMSVMMNYQTSWYDQSYASNPSCKYVVEVSLPDCNVLTKSNINTSRSNIKNQQSNSTIAGETSSIPHLQGTDYSVGPNPATDVVTVSISEKINGNVWVSDMKGQVFNAAVVEGTSIDLDISSLTSGVYMVNLENNGVVTSKKFIKK